MPFKNSIFATLVVCLFIPNLCVGQEASDRSKDAIAQRLELAGKNRSELVLALKEVGADQKPGLEFLIEHMPLADLKTLSSKFLLSNVRLAYQARNEAPWKLTDEMFFNEVLPYANIDEPRDPWRQEMYELCKPIVANAATPTEAVQALNANVFKKLSVKYSTKRKRANQSPKESIEQGLASCTGLSIILVDACRSVGVPARLAGIPSWTNKRGNHTWVEIWDKDWHFTGAAEYNPKGLNRTWFQGDAALADPNSKMHSIYAVSFRNTDVPFPFVWRSEDRVSAENVTSRYTKTKMTEPSSKVNVMIRLWNSTGTERVVKAIEVACPKCVDNFKGTTKGRTADMNDMLAFELEPTTKYELIVGEKKRAFETTSDKNQLFEFLLGPNLMRRSTVDQK